MLSFVGYMLLLFCLHSATPLPFKLQKLSEVETVIRDEIPYTHPALNLSQRSYNMKNEYQRSVLPSGYSDFSGCEGSDIRVSAYKFHHTKKTWSDARTACFYEGGYLGYPECPEEGRKYHRILKYVNNGGAWIGLHDFYEEGDWLTIFDKEVNLLQYRNWAEDQPDNAGEDGENCAQIGEDGMWYDKPCNKESFFFCKIDI